MVDVTRATRTPGLAGTWRDVRNAVVLGRERRDLLTRHGWYRNLGGGWTHPHCLDFMSSREIRGYSPAQLEYKLEHGSRTPLPENLRRRRRRGGDEP